MVNLHEFSLIISEWNILKIQKIKVEATELKRGPYYGVL